VTRIQPQYVRPTDGALTSQADQSYSVDDISGLSDSDPDPSSDDDGYSSDEQERSRTSKHSRWSDLDEQHLLAYKKEGKPWDWIFGKFLGRTSAAVRMRLNMMQARVK
jgi:hypothetical protein